MAKWQVDTANTDYYWDGPISETLPHFVDQVEKPPHYNNGSIECIDYIKSFLSNEEYIGYLRGNIAKYMHRYKYKGKPVEDLKKAQWYLERLLNEEES